MWHTVEQLWWGGPNIYSTKQNYTLVAINHCMRVVSVLNTWSGLKSTLVSEKKLELICFPVCNCSGDRSVPCVVRRLIRSPDYLWVPDSSSMFYVVIVYCCVCVTVVVTVDVSYCVVDDDCCCVVVLWTCGTPLLLIIVLSYLGSLPIYCGYNY